MKNYLEKIVKMTDDGNLQVRKQALQLLCKFKISYGELWLKDKINGLDDRKKWEILRAKGEFEEEMMEIEEVKEKPEMKRSLILKENHVIKPMEPIKKAVSFDGGSSKAIPQK